MNANDIKDGTKNSSQEKNLILTDKPMGNKGISVKPLRSLMRKNSSRPNKSLSPGVLRKAPK